MFDEILERLGLTYDELTTSERETLEKWVEAADGQQISVSLIKDYISDMKRAVIEELVDEPEFNYIFLFKVPNRTHLLLKARLKNYTLLDSFLSTPERAKADLERYITAVAGRKGQNVS